MTLHAGQLKARAKAAPPTPQITPIKNRDNGKANASASATPPPKGRGKKVVLDSNDEGDDRMPCVDKGEANLDTSTEDMYTPPTLTAHTSRHTFACSSRLHACNILDSIQPY